MKRICTNCERPVSKPLWDMGVRFCPHSCRGIWQERRGDVVKQTLRRLPRDADAVMVWRTLERRLTQLVPQPKEAT